MQERQAEWFEVLGPRYFHSYAPPVPSSPLLTGGTVGQRGLSHWFRVGSRRDIKMEPRAGLQSSNPGGIENHLATLRAEPKVHDVLAPVHLLDAEALAPSGS